MGSACFRHKSLQSFAKKVRYLLRNGFAAMMLLLPPGLVFALISQSSLLNFMGSKGISPELFFPALVAYIVLILMTPAYNSFAYENAGVQTYFTAPLRFREVFLGKNFVQVCLIVIELAVVHCRVCYRVGDAVGADLPRHAGGYSFTV